jgi:hypothetical protein
VDRRIPAGLFAPGDHSLSWEIPMRRLALLVVLCSCATAGTPEDTSARPEAIFTGDKQGTLMADAPRPLVAAIPANPAIVWEVAKKIYAEFDVPVTLDKPAAHQLGNTNFYKMRQMGGKPLQDLVNCGMGMDGPKAAKYRVYMSLVSNVSGDGKGGTTIQTTLAASAVDISAGAGSDRVQCGSSGVLEYLINEKVAAALAKGH